MKENQRKSDEYCLYFVPCQLKSRPKFNAQDFVTKQGLKRLIFWSGFFSQVIKKY